MDLLDEDDLELFLGDFGLAGVVRPKSACSGVNRGEMNARLTESERPTAPPVERVALVDFCLSFSRWAEVFDENDLAFFGRSTCRHLPVPNASSRGLANSITGSVSTATAM